MANSNRPSKWADPSVAPVEWDPLSRKMRPRPPFKASPRLEKRNKARAEARERRQRLRDLEADAFYMIEPERGLPGSGRGTPLPRKGTVWR